MGPLKLAPVVSPNVSIGINNGVDQRPVTVVNAPVPMGVAVPGGPTISNWSGPAQSWSVAPAPQWKPYEMFGLGLHGFGSGTLRNFINSPFRMAYGVLQLGGLQSQVGGDVTDGGFKRGTGNLVGGFMDGPAWLVPASKAAKGAELAGKLPVAKELLGLAKTGAKLGGLYGGGQGYADSASAGKSWEDVGKSTAIGTAEGATAGAALGPAGYGAVKAGKAAPDAANLIKNLVMPNATSDKFFGTVAQHVISTGALQHDAEQKTAAGMDALTNAENKAVTTGELNHQLPAPSGSHMLPSGTQDANLLPAGPKALPAGNRFTTEHSTAVLEGNAKLVQQYTRDRNAIIRKYGASDLRNPGLRKQLDTLEKRYINKQKFMADQIDKAHPPKAEKTGTVKVAGVDTGLRPNATFDEIKAEYQRFIDDMPGTKHYNMTTRQRTAYANKLRQMAEKAKSTPPPVEKPRVVQLSQQGETVPTTRAYGKTIEMTPENGYKEIKAADGGSVYRKSSMQGSNARGTRGPVVNWYMSDGTKINAVQAQAIIDGRLSSGRIRTSVEQPKTPTARASSEELSGKSGASKAKTSRGVSSVEGEAKTSPSTTPSTREQPSPTSESLANPANPASPTADLLDPTTGKRVQGQSALLEHMRNGDLPGKTTQHLRVLVHEVHNQNMLRQAASRFVKENPEMAKDVYFSGQLEKLGKYDSHAALGRAVNYAIAKEGESPNAAMHAFQRHATNLGQGMRALNEDLLTPEGAVSRAMKVADAKGRQAVTPERVGQIEQMVNKINGMPEGAAKDEAVAGLKTLIDNPSLWEKSANLGQGLISLPRAIMASADLSFGLRQGAVLGSRFPKIWAKAQAISAASFASPEAYQKEVARLTGLKDKNGIPLIDAAKAAGIDLEALFGRSEEVFGNTDIAESKALKKVGIGHVVSASDRAFSIAAAHMRMEIFKNIIDKEGGLNAVENKWSSKQLKLLGRVINTGTGRGHGKEGGWFEKAAPTLGKTLFSARLWKSRLDLINPLYYAQLRKNPAALKLAIQSTGSFGAVVGITLAAAAAAGATVETDLRSSDFGKIKIGNTRYDIMGGLQQNLVLAWREISGEYKSSTSGQVTDLTKPKFGGANRLTIIGRTVENKLAPVIAEAIRQIQGNDISGQPFKNTTARLKDASSLVIPLNVQDTYSTAQDRIKNGGGAKGAALGVAESAVPGTFGVGVQTYSPSAKQQVQKQTGLPPQDTSVADTVKAALSGATLTINGQKVKWNDLSTQQKEKLAQTNQDAYDYYTKEQAINTAMGPGKVYDPRLSQTAKDTLNYFDHLSAKGKAVVMQKEPGAAYALAQAKYEQDMLAGKFADPAKQAEADKSLAKAKVGSTYSQAVRDAYGMSKGDLSKLLAQGNNRQWFNDLIAYDDALYQQGLISSQKFRNKYGTITLGIGGNGSSSGSGGSSRSSSRRSSRSRSSGTRKPKAVTVPRIRLERASYVPRLRSNRARRASGKPSVAIRKPHGKLSKDIT